MWRKHNCLDNILFEKPKSELTPQYVCQTCKCLLGKPAKIIKTYNIHLLDPYVEAYCAKCAPAYDEIRYGNYMKLLRVNYDGTPWVAPDAKKSK